MENAPHDGTLILLFDPRLTRHAAMPTGRNIVNNNIVVGRWHTPKQDHEKSDWVTDIRSIEYEDGQPYWEAGRIEPTHWIPLPNPAPSQGWMEAEIVPMVNEYLLLYDPKISQTREYPMNPDKGHSGNFNMVIGCYIDRTGKWPLWTTDLCDAGEEPDDPNEVTADAVNLLPTHWMVLPSPPTAGM